MMNETSSIFDIATFPVTGPRVQRVALGQIGFCAVFLTFAGAALDPCAMGNRTSVATVEFVNKSDCAKIEIQVGSQPSRFLQHQGITKFQIAEATPSVVRGYDKSGRLLHEVKFTVGVFAAAQLWKISNSGVKHKRSPFFTETYSWQK